MKKILFTLFPLLLSACGQNIEGTYSNNVTGVAEQKVSWIFNSDGTAELAIGSTKLPAVAPFEVSGNKVTVEGREGDIIFTILDDGSLVAEGMKYTKETTTLKHEQTSAKDAAAASQANEDEATADQKVAFSPSFDCERASIGSERLICSDRGLAALDVEMMSVYERLADGNPDKKALLDEQISWMKNKRDTCSTTECMADAYRSRIEEMEVTAQYLSKPAEFR